MVTGTYTRSVAALLVVHVAFSAPLLAQDVELSAPGADAGLVELLRNASVSISLANEGAPDAQDYVAAARADYRRLLTALYADGYYGGTISITVNGQEASQIAPLGAPDRIDGVAITVDPGPRFAFGRAEVAPLAPGTVLPEGFATGAPARSDEVREAVAASIRSWRNAGFAKAVATGQQITARHDDQTLDASVSLDPGPQLTFGPVTISGNQRVRTEAIRRIAGVPVGKVYSPQALEDAARRLRRTGAFDSVAFAEAEEIGPGNTLPIDLQLAEARLRRLGFGLELSSAEGLTASTYWLHRNALGGAERFRADLIIAGIGGETGGTDYSLSGSLGIPAIYKTETDFLATATISRENAPDYLIDKVEVGASLSREIPGNKTADIGVGLLAAHEETALGERDYILLTFPTSGTIDRRDDSVNARNGYFASLDLTPFVSLQGSANGMRIVGDGRIYRSFGADDRFTIAARGQLGSVLGADMTTAPADYLFFSGGGGTVRGQPYNALGIDQVVNGTTVTTGGLSFLGAQIEARIKATDKIGVVGFYDYGYVGASSLPLEDGDWHAGAGFGIRYDTGIGPIRLDVATPVQGDDAFGAVEVYIGIGQSF